MEAADDADDMEKYEKYEERLERLEVKMDTAIAKAETHSSMSLADVLNRLQKK